ncbi:MAG: ornithine carbamoyltransferase [Thermodesulfobacteriota bacterium]
MKKDLLTLLDLTQSDFDRLFELAIAFKKRRNQGIADRPLIGKSLALIFDKPSTRTRVSFEAAMVQLGGTPLYINTRDTQVSRNEPVRDTARVLARYVDSVAIRTFSQDLLEEFAEFASIPVINALTDRYHPTQVLSDLMTVIECFGTYSGIRVAWIGDGNNVAHSWINAAAVLGFDLVLACPKGYHPDSGILERARGMAAGRISVVSDPREAASGAHVLYTDVWASMGQESEQAERKKIFQGFQIDRQLVSLADPEAIVLHCLPAHRGEEVSEELLEDPKSVIWNQAENKMHMNKAILMELLTKGASHA